MLPSSMLIALHASVVQQAARVKVRAGVLVLVLPGKE